MTWKITHITVNHPEGETEYTMDRHITTVHLMMQEIKERHPNVTSVVVIMLKDD